MRLSRLTAIFVALGAAALYFRRHQRTRAALNRRDSELVDEAGLQSFPASDPPGWTLGGDR